MSYTVRGSGPGLLWLSGYAVPVAAFDEVLSRLARWFTVVAVDHRGSGESRTRPLPTTTGTMARDAVSVLNHLGLASAHVVGVSLGGMVAQELALSHPWRVRSLVLCSTTAGGSGAKTPPVGDLLSELQRTGAKVPVRFRIRTWGALHQAAAAGSHDATHRLPRISAPTLVLHGGADELVPLQNAEWLASRVPGADLRTFAGGSHLLLLESPAAREALEGWLHEHRGAEPGAASEVRARLSWYAEAPQRVFLGQSLPLRRTVRVGSRLVRARRPRPGPGTP